MPASIFAPEEAPQPPPATPARIRQGIAPHVEARTEPTLTRWQERPETEPPRWPQPPRPGTPAPVPQPTPGNWPGPPAVVGTQALSAEPLMRGPGINAGDGGGTGFTPDSDGVALPGPVPGPAPMPVMAGDAAAATRAQAGLAREAAQQISAQVLNLGKGRFGLSLAPAELGRVEMWLQDTDNRLTLTVNAERPETMDLMRRHIGLLEQELRQMGLGGLSLQLGNEGAPGAQTGAHSHPPPADEAAVAPPENPHAIAPPGALPGDRLDLRL